MEKTLKVLNGLEESGVISRYAIGGAIAATFYVESVVTFDLDIFILLPTKGNLLTLEPIYTALRRRGYAPKGEFVMIEGVPVQFLPAHNTLLEEALTEAVSQDYGKTKTRVLTAEHLLAIALQTGRPKDRDRVRLLFKLKGLDRKSLSGILKRHRLEKRMKEWQS